MPLAQVLEQPMPGVFKVVPVAGSAGLTGNEWACFVHCVFFTPIDLRRAFSILPSSPYHLRRIIFTVSSLPYHFTIWSSPYRLHHTVLTISSSPYHLQHIIFIPSLSSRSLVRLGRLLAVPHLRMFSQSSFYQINLLTLHHFWQRENSGTIRSFTFSVFFNGRRNTSTKSMYTLSTYWQPSNSPESERPKKSSSTQGG